MDIAALIAWLITAGGGFVLLGRWITQGGHRADTRPPSRLLAGQVFGHFVLAATGLVLWVIYLATDEAAWAWTAFIVLIAVALLGFSMFFRWWPQVREQAPVGRVATGGTAPAGRRAEATPEARFPVPVVAAHGLAGATTLILVLLAAAQA